MTDLRSPKPLHAAAHGLHDQSSEAGARPAHQPAVLPPFHVGLPLRQQALPAAPRAITAANRGGSLVDLPPELICKIASHLAPPDARHYARVNRQTNQALADLKALRQSERDRQLVLMERGRWAPTPMALMAVAQDILTLQPGLRAEPLAEAGTRLGKMAGPQAGTVFRTLWQAVIELPPRQIAEPLFAMARQLTVLPPEERLAAMEAALAQMRQLPMDARRHRTTRDWAYLLMQLPANHAATGLQHLVAEAWQFSQPQRQQFVQLLRSVTAPVQTLHGIQSRVSLSPEDRHKAHAAMEALLAAAPGDREGSTPASNPSH